MKKMNGKYRTAWLLCLTLWVVLWAVSGCQTQPAQEPMASPSPEPTQIVVEQRPTSTTLPEPERVTVEQVQQWMDEGVPLTILDSRSDAAWGVATTQVPGSLRVPPTDVEPHLTQIPRDRRIIVYCT
jgi:hypothetical protein